MASFVFGCHFLAIVFSTWTAASSEAIFSSESMQFSVAVDRRMNENVNPCDDFYRYACFNPTAHVTTMAAVDSNKKIIITNRLQTGKKTSDGEAVNKYYDLYNQCTAVHTGKNVNQTILDYVHDFDKLFEGADNHKLDATQLAKVTAYLLVHHDVSLITAFGKIKPVDKRFSKFGKILTVGTPELIQQKYFYFDQNQADNIKHNLHKYFKYANSTADEENFNKTVSDMFDLEFAIAKILVVPIELQSIRILNVSGAVKAFPTLDWRTFVTSIASYSGVDVLNGTKLDDYPLAFVSTNATNSILEIISKTPPELLRNYFKTRIVLRIATSVLGNCEALTTVTLPLVKQHLYITDLYPTTADRANFKHFATKTVDNIIASARKMLEEIPWIKNDKQMYAGFTEKINKLTKMIGYPDELVDQAHLDQLHADFALSPNETLISLYLKSSKFLAKSALDDRIDPFSDSTALNAYYDPMSNKIIIPATMLQMVSPNDVPAAIYGSIGTVIGHEIIHGFDNKGVQFDGDGYINPWMSQAGQASFDSMAQCVVNEYNQFNATDGRGKTFKVNGKQTVGENVADIGGLQAAYNAFLSDPEWNKIFPRTPKLKDITNEQLFFLAFNRFWCMPPNLEFIASRDTHSPYNIRVLGTLRNFEPFRKAFNCPVNSKYAPEKHCDVYALSDARQITSNVVVLTLMSVLLILIAC